jgi:predicted RNA-binding protein YlxR (DUF448 family)
MNRKTSPPEEASLEETARAAIRAALVEKPPPKGPKPKKTPIRTCVACREESPKRDLVRIVRTTDGEVKLDATGRLNGHGAYLHPRMDCLKLAVKKRALDRDLGAPVSAEQIAALETELTALTAPSA